MARLRLKALIADVVQEQVRRIVTNGRLKVAKIESVQVTPSSDLVTLIRVKTLNKVHYYEVKVSEKI